jgi:mannosyl-oligosaccharide alpha-1,2-mannosidase
MLRMRRYRLFLLLATLTVFLLYRFSQPSAWEPSTSAAAIKDKLGLNDHRGSASSGSHRTPSSHHDTPKLHDDKEKPKRPQSQPPSSDKDTPNLPKIPSQQPEKVKPPPAEGIPKPVQKEPPPKTPASISANALADPPSEFDVEIVLTKGGEARVDLDGTPTNGPKERWSKLPEHYPVPTESIIPLPTGKGKPIPKVQHKFGKESKADKATRLQRLETIKEHFLHAYNGYKTRAWGLDELKPVSGKSRNTFNGWSATMVDAMDTMWIMGLKTEFEEAVDFVKNIDFYSSTRNEIPIFETTIRYLGGLVGAYDVSNGKYPVLLEKAKELGDFIMAAFDTPNRMPLTYYPWKAAYASQPHRASTAVLAEIGSLQMEFTRLAQLTGNSSYYDAITRVIDALEVMQENTTMPGLWPTDIDTSGCAKSDSVYPAPGHSLQGTFTYLNEDSGNFDKPKMEPIKKPAPLIVGLRDDKGTVYPPPIPLPPLFPAAGTKDGPSRKEEPLNLPDPLVFTVKDPEKAQRQKRQALTAPENYQGSIPTAPNPPNSVPEPGLLFTGRTPPQSGPIYAAPPSEGEACVKWGLSASSNYEKYTLGSTADSAFEYLPKQFILLAGQVDKYRTMYERAIDVANENLIVRVMIPDDTRELLVAGEVHYSSYGNVHDRTFHPDQTHLVCFVGGMFALGSKIFNRPNDLEIAAKLTDACVWSYESTASGIMPEGFQITKCASRTSCPWNQTAWYEDIDPAAESRMKAYEAQMKTYNSQMAEWSSSVAASKATPVAAVAAKPAPPAPFVPSHLDANRQPTRVKNPAGSAEPARAQVTSAQQGAREPPAGFDPLKKPPPHARIEHMDKRQVLQDDGAPSMLQEKESAFKEPSLVEDDDPAASIWKPTKPTRPETMEQAAARQIKDYRLKPGMRSVKDPRYILRYVFFWFQIFLNKGKKKKTKRFLLTASPT